MRTNNENFIVRMNAVEEGLNFLVPSAWWKNFLQNNQDIKCHREMRLMESYPLDYLFETGVVQQPLPGYRKSFGSIRNEAIGKLKSVKRQVKKAESAQQNESIGKRSKMSCEWLWQDKQCSEQDYDILLLSPEIKPEVAQLFQIGSEDWIIVTPQLYWLIWQEELRDRRQQQQRIMIAIPVLVANTERVYIDQTIDYHNLRYVELVMKTFSGESVNFMGYIQGDVSLKNLIQWMRVGLTKLISGERQQLKHNNDIIVLQMFGKADIIAYQFYDDQYNERLKWIEFQEIQHRRLQTSAISRIIVLSGENKDTLQEFQLNNDASNRVDGIKEGKKRKRESLQRLGSEGRPICIGEEGSNFCRVDNQIDSHSSTQGETPSQFGQRDVIIIQQLQPGSTNERISFPLWKEGLSHQNLCKFAQLKLTIPKMFKPHSDQTTIVVRDEGKKIVLPRQCNELTKNEQGQWIQKQVSERIMEDADVPSLAAKRQLQLLALEILGLKICEVSEEAEKVEVDLVKESSYCEDKTCKNEFMDQFDCEESNFQ